MNEIIKGVLDRNGILDRQKQICEEMEQKLTEGGYIQLSRVKIDPERLMLAVAEVMNKLQEDNPLIVEG